MDKNSMAIIVLCSHLCAADNVRPFEPAEWAIFAEKLMVNKTEPYELMSFSNDDFMSRLDLSPDETGRITQLIRRSGSIAYEVEKYSTMV